MRMRPFEKAAVLALSLAAPRRLAQLMLQPATNPMRGTLETTGMAERVEIPAPGGGVCKGWWVSPAGGSGKEFSSAQRASGAGRVVVLAHGWTSHYLRMSMFVEPLLAAGYTVLIYNARGHGDSDPAPHISLAGFTTDLTAAVAFAHSRVEHVAVLGHSMGAAAGIVAAADGVPIEALVALAPPTHPVRASVDILNSQGIDGDLIFRRIGRHVQEIIGRRFETFTPEMRMKDVTCPVLVLHGTADETVLVDHFHRLKANAGPGVEMMLVEGATHDSLKVDPQTWPRIRTFLASAFPAAPE